MSENGSLRPQPNCGQGVPPVTSPARRRRHSFRRGYILVVVLGIAVVVTTLGIAFIEANSTAMPEAMNRVAASRARYLAESGVDVATHFLLYPPTTVAVGDYWAGALGIAIDATADYVDVAVAQDPTDESIFEIKATGVSHDFDGYVIGKHGIAAKVLVPGPPKWEIPYAYLGTTHTTLPGSEVILGDLHVNGDLTAGSKCQGNVSATGTIAWSGSGPPASIVPFAAAYVAPSIDPALWASYELVGRTFAALTHTGPVLTVAEATALSAQDLSATNPGRVILAPPGDFVVEKDAVLAGTLVVTGNLYLEQRVTITAAGDFPALVVTGDVFMSKSGPIGQNPAVTIDGSLLCGGQIVDQGIKKIELNVTGAAVMVGMDLSENDGLYTFTWDADRASFWNFEPTAVRDPITILAWKEN